MSWIYKKPPTSFYCTGLLAPMFSKASVGTFFLIVAFLTLAPLRATTTTTTSDPAEAFLAAYQNFQEGERLEREGKKSKAFEKYQFSQSILNNLSANYPDWQKAVVDYRLAKVTQSLQNLQQPTAGSSPVDSPENNSSNNTSTQEAKTYPREQVSSLPVTHPVAGDIPSISIIPPTSASSDSTKSLSDQEIALLQKQLKKAEEDLGKAHEDIADKTTELDHSKVLIVDMKSQLEKTERQVTDLKNDLSQVRFKSAQREAQLQNSVHALEGKVTALSADQEVVLEENNALQQHLKQATDSLLAGASAKDHLEQLQLDMNAEKNASAALHEKLAVAYHERDAAQGTSQNLQKQLQETTAALASLKKDAQDTTSLRSRIEALQQEDAAKDKMLAEAQTVKKNLEDAQKNSAEEQQKKMLADQASEAATEQKIKELEDQLQHATTQVATFQKTGTDAAALQTQITSLTGQLDESKKHLVEMTAAHQASEESHHQAVLDLESKLQLAIKERATLEGKKAELDQQLAAAHDKIKVAAQAEQEQAALKTDLTECKAQLQESVKNLAESEKKIAALEQAEPAKNRLLEDKEKELAAARQESEKYQKDLSAANQKLSALQAEVQTKDDRYNDLKKEFDAKSEELSDLKKNQEQHPSDEKALAENELLKGIVLRELKAEAKRQQTKKLITEELEKLKLNSTTLSTELKKLAKPVKLSPEERALFKDTPLPVASAENSSDVEEETVVLSVAASKKEDAKKEDGATSLTPATPVTEAVMDPSTAPLPAELAASSATTNSLLAVTTNPPVASVTASSPNDAASKALAGNNPTKKNDPADYHKVVAKAKEQFEHQNYIEAERSFQDALALAPADYLTLSNLGVVQFQLGKMSEAEATLKKAVELDRKKSFALTTLGIVHYRQERMDEAEQVLRQAIAVNDQDFTAHNYLGIVLAASGKGKAGESEIMKALEINPQYADAHFNLAVIYATGKPPAKEMAKTHYTKAKSLGAPADPTLEKLLE